MDIIQDEPKQFGGLRSVGPFATRTSHIPKLFNNIQDGYRGAGIFGAALEIALYRMMRAKDIG